MRKIICITILFSVICGNIFSQNGKKLSESEKQVFEQKMIEESKKITTLQCILVLEKTSSQVAEKTVMKGTMMYQSPSKLRLEFTDPAPSTFILNGNNAVSLDKNGESTGNEKKLKQLGNFIIMMISGKGITQQNKTFSSEFYELDDARILIVLTPAQKHLKDLFYKIELRVDPKTMLSNEITLDEKTGDKTIIFLKNKVLNTEIPQDKFSIK